MQQPVSLSFHSPTAKRFHLQDFLLRRKEKKYIFCNIKQTPNQSL